MTERPSDQEPIDCVRLRRSPFLQVYLDGELPAADMLKVRLHLARCPMCRQAAKEERVLRRRLREELPRVMPPSDLCERVRRNLRRGDLRARAARYFGRAGPAAPGFAAALVLVIWALRIGASEPDLVKDLVSNHRLYSGLEAPAEMASASRLEVARWLRRQLALPVPVPDFGQAGLRLIGARLATHRQHPMVHLFYEKGRTLLSLYVLPASDLSLPRRGWTTLDGHEVLIRESTGHQVVLGRSGRFVFALVSTLDREALIECTRVFLREGGRREAARASSPVPGV